MMHKIRAVTLIELLIAASIFSMVILSVYSAFYTGVLSYQKVDSSFAIYQSARMLLNRIELDLKNTFSYTEKESKFKGDASGVDFFTTLDSFTQDKPSSSLAHIKYNFSSSSLKRLVLLGADALKKEEDTEGQEISNEIKELAFEYAYLTGKEDKPYDWQDSWPKDDTQVPLLPQAVKIKLALAQKDKRGKESIVEFNKTVSLLR